jgi:hypothetical protein
MVTRHVRKIRRLSTPKGRKGGEYGGVTRDNGTPGNRRRSTVLAGTAHGTRVLGL